MNPYYAKALSIAEETHRNDKRRDGTPYLLHVIRVAYNFTELAIRHGMTEHFRHQGEAAALLHDTLEDHPEQMSLARLELEFPNTYISYYVDKVSRKKGEIYDDFILRAGRNDVARLIKLADLSDNLRDLPEYDILRERYEKAYKKLAKTE